MEENKRSAANGSLQKLVESLRYDRPSFQSCRCFSFIPFIVVIQLLNNRRLPWYEVCSYRSRESRNKQGDACHHIVRQLHRRSPIILFRASNTCTPVPIMEPPPTNASSPHHLLSESSVGGRRFHYGHRRARVRCPE